MRFLNKLLAVSCLLIGPQMTALEKPGLQLLEKYCFDCHSDGVDKGNFEFDKLLKLDPKSAASKDTWHKVWDVIEEHQMPPANKKKQPTQEERETMMIALEQKIFSIERSQKYAGEIELGSADPIAGFLKH